MLLNLLIAPAARAEILEVGAGKTYALPSLAIAAAHDGDDIKIAPGRYFDCAIVAANDVVIEGDPGGGTIFDGKACQGKAALVTAGAGIAVRDLTLTNIRVADRNGAGIRVEGRDLTVERVQFLDNENGILAANNATSSIVVRDSKFIGNGVCAGACAHGVYAGHIGLLRIERSTFRETRQGHHIKSRAERTEIVDCDISDGKLGNSSYLIDIPNGGSLLVQHSTMQKGPLSQNHTAAIMIGAEGASNPTSEITIAGNAFRNDGAYDTYFVDNNTSAQAVLTGNHLAGRAKPLKGAGHVTSASP